MSSSDVALEVNFLYGMSLLHSGLQSLSTAGLTWTRLPHVTPAQIVAARQIRHFFTGDLDHVV